MTGYFEPLERVPKGALTQDLGDASMRTQDILFVNISFSPCVFFMSFTDCMFEHYSTSERAQLPDTSGCRLIDFVIIS